MSRTHSHSTFTNPGIGWISARIGDLIQEIDKPIPVHDGEMYKLVSVRRNNGGLFYRKPLYGREILTKDLREVVPGSFLIATRQIVHGACSYVGEEFAGSAISSSYSTFMGTPRCDIKYFSWLARHPILRQYFTISSHGIVIEKMNFDQRWWLDLKVSVPPIREQRRITEILDTLDEAIRSTEKVIAKLGAVRKGLLESSLNDQGAASWPRKEVSQWGEVKLGRQRSPATEQGNGMTPYLRVANVFDGRIDFSDVHTMNFNNTEREAFYLRHGDILLNEGQSLELVGRCAKYSGPERTFCFQNTLVRFRGGADIDPDFAYLTFSWWQKTGQFIQIAKQTTSIAHLGADRFARMQMRVPDIERQRSICQIIGTHDSKLATLHSHLNKLRGVKQGLVDDLLTGQVRVRV